jgi:DeoR family transcriptional regulator of aga operon
MAERHEQILKLLKAKKYTSVIELSKQLDVSVVTIRKDLSFLEEQKLVFRSHGSATLQNPYVMDKHVNEKAKINAEEKKQIGIKATELIQSNDTIILASGTTINEFARQLVAIGGITVICASITASEVLTSHKEIEIIQLGGILRKSSTSVVGPLAEEMLLNFTCNKLFLGVDGIDIDYGLTTTNAMEASLNKVMIKSAQKIIVLADSSKLNRKGFGHICNLDKIDTIVTDKKADKSTIMLLEDKGIQIIIA